MSCACSFDVRRFVSDILPPSPRTLATQVCALHGDVDITFSVETKMNGANQHGLEWRRKLESCNFWVLQVVQHSAVRPVNCNFFTKKPGVLTCRSHHNCIFFLLISLSTLFLSTVPPVSPFSKLGPFIPLRVSPRFPHPCPLPRTLFIFLIIHVLRHAHPCSIRFIHFFFHVPLVSLSPRSCLLLLTYLDPRQNRRHSAGVQPHSATQQCAIQFASVSDEDVQARKMAFFLGV